MRQPRLTAAQRITGALWGVIVLGAAVAAMYALSGNDVNLTNVVIVALLALGGWLVVSALAAARPRRPRSQPDAVVTEAPELAEASGTEDA